MIRSTRRIVFAAMVFVHASCWAQTSGERAGYREFRDQRGRAIEARVLRVSGDKVTVERRDGKQSTVSVSVFSQTDQDYIRGLTSGRKPEEANEPPRKKRKYTAGEVFWFLVIFALVMTLVTFLWTVRWQGPVPFPRHQMSRNFILYAAKAGAVFAANLVSPPLIFGCGALADVLFGVVEFGGSTGQVVRQGVSVSWIPGFIGLLLSSIVALGGAAIALGLIFGAMPLTQEWLGGLIFEWGDERTLDHLCRIKKHPLRHLAAKELLKLHPEGDGKTSEVASALLAAGEYRRLLQCGQEGLDLLLREIDEWTEDGDSFTIDKASWPIVARELKSADMLDHAALGGIGKMVRCQICTSSHADVASDRITSRIIDEVAELGEAMARALLKQVAIIVNPLTLWEQAYRFADAIGQCIPNSLNFVMREFSAPADANRAHGIPEEDRQLQRRGAGLLLAVFVGSSELSWAWGDDRDRKRHVAELLAAHQDDPDRRIQKAVKEALKVSGWVELRLAECPHCRARFGVRRIDAGKRAKCSKCGRQFVHHRWEDWEE